MCSSDLKGAALAGLAVDRAAATGAGAGFVIFLLEASMAVLSAAAAEVLAPSFSSFLGDAGFLREDPGLETEAGGGRKKK